MLRSSLSVSRVICPIRPWSRRDGFAIPLRTRGSPCQDSHRAAIIEPALKGYSHSRILIQGCLTMGEHCRSPRPRDAFSWRALASPPGRALRRVDRRVRDHSPVARRPMLKHDRARCKSIRPGRRTAAPEVAWPEAAAHHAAPGAMASRHTTNFQFQGTESLCPSNRAMWEVGSSLTNPFAWSVNQAAVTDYVFNAGADTYVTPPYQTRRRRLGK